MQALFVLAFAIGLHGLGARSAGGRGARGRRPARGAGGGLRLRLQLPGPRLARRGGRGLGGRGAGRSPPGRRLAGPGAGRAGRCARRRSRSGPSSSPSRRSSAGWSTSREFETFDPDGAGLGNLFNRISPLEALGIWPSGDFRIDPGDGFAPAIALLARRGRRSCGARLRPVVVAQARRAGGAGRPRASPAPSFAYAAARRHAVPGGEGDRARRAARDAGERPGAGRWQRRAWQQAVRIVRRRGIARLFPRSARVARARLGVGALAAAFAALRPGSRACSPSPTGRWARRRWSPDLLERKPLPGPTPGAGAGGLPRRASTAATSSSGSFAAGRSAWRSTPGRHRGQPPPGIAQVVVVRRLAAGAVRGDRRRHATWARSRSGESRADPRRVRVPVHRRRRPGGPVRLIR